MASYAHVWIMQWIFFKTDCCVCRRVAAAVRSSLCWDGRGLAGAWQDVAGAGSQAGWPGWRWCWAIHVFMGNDSRCSNSSLQASHTCTNGGDKELRSLGNCQGGPTAVCLSCWFYSMCRRKWLPPITAMGLHCNKQTRSTGRALVRWGGRQVLVRDGAQWQGGHCYMSYCGGNSVRGCRLAAAGCAG
jgi:hypothetical protein